MERAWLADASREFEKAALRTHYVLGNHCVQTLTKKQFLSDIGRERSYYSFDHAGWRFLVLDACYRKDGVSYDAGNYDWKDTRYPRRAANVVKGTARVCFGEGDAFLVHQRLDLPGVHTVASAGDVRQFCPNPERCSLYFRATPTRTTTTRRGMSTTARCVPSWKAAVRRTAALAWSPSSATDGCRSGDFVPTAVRSRCDGPCYPNVTLSRQIFCAQDIRSRGSLNKVRRDLHLNRFNRKCVHQT